MKRFFYCSQLIKKLKKTIDTLKIYPYHLGSSKKRSKKMTFDKTKTTSKHIKALAAVYDIPILSAGYCGKTWNLLEKLGKRPIYYNSGLYGWNYDVYLLNDCIIITGYRPFNCCFNLDTDLNDKINFKEIKSIDQFNKAIKLALA